MYPGSEQIEALGEKLLPEFHQVFVLFYLLAGRVARWLQEPDI